MNDIVVAPPMILAPSLFLPSPNFREKFAAAPLPIRPATALKIITKGNMTLVAALPNVPTPLPMNIWSTIL